MAIRHGGGLGQHGGSGDGEKQADSRNISGWIQLAVVTDGVLCVRGREESGERWGFGSGGAREAMPGSRAHLTQCGVTGSPPPGRPQSVARGSVPTQGYIGAFSFGLGAKHIKVM